MLTKLIKRLLEGRSERKAQKIFKHLQLFSSACLSLTHGGNDAQKTMGSKITTLNPMKGCAAEGGAAALLFVATECGIPMSTTQTVTGAIAGVGLAKDKKSINWPMLTRIFISWLLTMPTVGLMAALFMTYFI